MLRSVLRLSVVVLVLALTCVEGVKLESALEARIQQIGGEPVPQLPTYFRAKARAWMHTSREPLLLLYHYDGPGKRTREDYYTLIDTFHKRFMSDFRNYYKVRR